MTLRRLRRDESGIAMITALLGIIILAGLAVVFLSRATAETRATSFSQDFESALHVAEAAADARIAAVAEDEEHVTTDVDGLEFMTVDAHADERAEAAWVLAMLDKVREEVDGAVSTTSEAWLEGNFEGEAFAFRPRSHLPDSETGEYEPAEVIYAASGVPSFTASQARVRVVKLQVDQAVFTPSYAILTNGTFSFGGNAEVLAPGCDESTEESRERTCYADIHTNQEYTHSGNSSTIQGAVSVSEGSCPTTTATNGCEEVEHNEDIPRIFAEDYYDPSTTALQGGAQWVNLCPDGTVRQGSSTDPCAGEELWPGTTGETTHRGWRWRDSQNEWRADSIQSGAYYVHHADVAIRGSDGDEQHHVSLMVSQNPANRNESGSVDIAGNPRMQAALKDALIIADADITMNGNAGVGSCDEAPASLAGLIYAGEQFNTQGTVTLRGAIMVDDRAEDHNLVQRNNASIGGTMCLEYDRDMSMDLEGQWVVTFWNEL